MKKILFVIPIIVFVAAGCNSSQQIVDRVPVSEKTNRTTTSTTATKPSWQTYSNQALGFQLQYPDDWKVESVSDVSNNSPQLTGVFAISKQIPSTDQYGDPMTTTAQFSIAVENIPGVSIQNQSQRIVSKSNLTLGGTKAVRDVQDGPQTIYTVVSLIKNEKLLRISYSWSAVSGQGQIDSKVAIHKQEVLDISNQILVSFK